MQTSQTAHGGPAFGGVIQGKDIAGPLTLTCDVVVIGSGAGGAAAAYELSNAGLEVIVCEEGGYNRTQDFGSSPVDSVKRLYRDAGTNIIFGTPDILFSEGRTVGGSTVINGGLSWRASEKVLKRWVWEFGLPPETFSARALTPVYDRVERIIHAAPQSADSIGEDSHRIKRGCDALGYKTTPVRRSQRDCVGTNQCVFGCPSGAKQSTLVSYLPRAVQRGARIYADTKVQRIMVDRKGRARGVLARVDNPFTGQRHTLRIEAQSVVCAAGAVQTPLLLMASGVGNRWVGRNLLVHPNAKVIGVFDEEIMGWQGTIQGFQVHEFLDEGLMMATTFVPPALLAMATPYFGAELMEFMRDYNRMVVAGVLVEDSTSGRVRRGPGGQAIMRYDIAPSDFAQMLRGVALLAEILFAAGARKVLLPIDGLATVSGLDEIRRIFSTPIRPRDLELLTVHAMGTARLADTSARGACGPDGQLFGHEGLYVADASLFPAPLGINPQETIMALATHVAWEAAGALARGRPS